MPIAVLSSGHMKIRVARKPANAYQHGNLREALVQAGLKLLTEQGVQGLSLRGAAQLAGVSHAAPYRHFKDKDALVAAIAEQGFRLLSASMQQQIDALGGGDVPSPKRLLALGKGYLQFALNHPAYLQVIFGGVLSPTLITPELQAASTDAYALLRDCVAEGIARGQFRQGDPELLSLAAWSMVHGLAHLMINNAVQCPSETRDSDLLGENLLSLLGDGLFTRA